MQNEVVIEYQGSEENNKNISLDSQSQGQIINLVSVKHTASILTTQM
jgi:hypothetical protein